MSTDVYIDYSPKPMPPTPTCGLSTALKIRPQVDAYYQRLLQWHEDSGVIRIGYLYTMNDLEFSLLDYLQKLRQKYPIFNNLTLSELRGVLREFDAFITQENQLPETAFYNWSETSKHEPCIHGVDRSTFNDYLTEEMALEIFPNLLGKYWYLRVD